MLLKPWRVILAPDNTNSATESHTPSTYQVLARRTRPQSFSELVGQDVAAQALTSMIESQRIPHAFLFTGTRGTGKTSSARILAKSLCCEQGPTAHPCQTCVHCRQITACAHDDILEIDGASNNGVDEIRRLKENALLYPASARYKIFIIDEVHMISVAAFNALLKILEEPPPQVIFILATTELHKVPLTVRSRCMVLTFRKVALETLTAHLARILEQEHITYEPDALTLIAREARGSIRDALSLLEQVIALCGHKHITYATTQQALSVLGQELATELFQAICARNACKALEMIRNADATSMDLSLLLEECGTLFRKALIVRSLQDDTDAARVSELLPAEIAMLRQHTATLSLAALSEIYRTLSQTATDIARAVSGRGWAELGVLDAIHRADWLSVAELLGNATALPSAHQPSSEQHHPEKKTELKQNSSLSSAKLASTTTHPTEKAEHAETQNNFELWKNVVEYIKNKNPRLGVKLKQVAIKSISKERIEFAPVSESINAMLEHLTPNDSELFMEALKAYQLADAEVIGINLPLKKKIHPPLATSSPSAIARQNEASEKQSPSHNSKSKGISLAEIEQQEFANKLQHILHDIQSKEYMKSLFEHSASAKVIKDSQSFSMLP